MIPNERKHDECPEPRGCMSCKRYGDDVSTCKLLNCHRAYGQKELENKDYVTDAWEPST